VTGASAASPLAELDREQLETLVRGLSILLSTFLSPRLLVHPCVYLGWGILGTCRDSTAQEGERRIGNESPRKSQHFAAISGGSLLEASPGFEPGNDGFANHQQGRG
jgi:hypothetical protein